MRSAMKSWLKDFEWGEDDGNLWRRANENGASVTMEYLLKQSDRFITVDLDLKTGDFHIDVLWGPMHLKFSRKDMDLIPASEVSGSNENTRYYTMFAKPAVFGGE